MIECISNFKSLIIKYNNNKCISHNNCLAMHNKGFIDKDMENNEKSNNNYGPTNGSVLNLNP